MFFSDFWTSPLTIVQKFISINKYKNLTKLLSNRNTNKTMYMYEESKREIMVKEREGNLNLSVFNFFKIFVSTNNSVLINYQLRLLTLILSVYNHGDPSSFQVLREETKERNPLILPLNYFYLC